jgi:hypothetical protein
VGLIHISISSAAYVVSLNLRESRRALAAAKLANLGEGGPKETASIEAVSQARAASLLNVSRSAVQRARKVVGEGGERPARTAFRAAVRI